MSRKEQLSVKNIASQVDISILDNLTDQILENENGWKVVSNKNGIKVFTKKNVFGGITSIRYQSEINQKMAVIEDFAYSEMLKNMPLWSNEFIEGKNLNPSSENKDVKLLKTKFKTPFFLKNRSYVFNLVRIKKENTLKVIYESVGDTEFAFTEKGFVRSRLYPTVYKFTDVGNGTVKIEHILSTDLGVDLPLWFQNSKPVVNGVVKANINDCTQIKKALESY